MLVLSKSYSPPPFCEREILRYVGCRKADGEIKTVLNECIAEARDKLTYKVCYRIAEIKIREDLCDFGIFSIKSNNLAENLKGSAEVIIFAATVGIEIDRLIAKYGRISPVKALFMQAIGAERIEALCNTFCEDISKENGLNLKPRFSAGYGDLDLEIQKNIFSVLECEKRIGLTLNESLLMSPTKSVTAFVGITKQR